jgi:YjbE family integral membrane protein
LAGDNAIVIAMAARNLPPHLQKKAILWGAAGAIAVRSLMTLVVVYLLNIPGLMLVGGLLLVWIAYRLLCPSQEDGEHAQASTTFWGAMKTIVIADAVMGLDNVLAVAGASQYSDCDLGLNPNIEARRALPIHYLCGCRRVGLDSRKDDDF